MISLIDDLLKRFEALELACQHVAKAINNDTHLPLHLTSFEGASGAERAIAIQSITQLEYKDSDQFLPNSGLLCAFPTTINAIHALNTTKDAFKTSVQALRAASKNDKTRIETLIARIVSQDGRRDEILAIALHRANLHRLDLNRCYAHIRVLPENLVSVSWSWAKSHSAIVQISLNDALQMAHTLSSPITKKLTLEKLSNLPFNTKLAYKKKLPNQLRANLIWSENDQRLRKAVTVSGILIVQAEKLPQYVWRTNPSLLDESLQSSRLLRSDAEIEVEPYIEVLHLHRYVGKSFNLKNSDEPKSTLLINDTQVASI